MCYWLFSPASADRSIQWKEIEDVLRELECGFTDTKEALTLLSRNIYSVYDGHVKDTNCQVRAIMVANIAQSYLHNVEKRRHLSATITLVEEKLIIICQLKDTLRRECEFAYNIGCLPDNPTFPKTIITMKQFMAKHNLDLGSQCHSCPEWSLDDLFSCYRIICYLFVLYKYKEARTINGLNTYRIEPMGWTRTRKISITAIQKIITRACCEFLHCCVDDQLLPPFCFSNAASLANATDQLTVIEDNGLVYAPTFLGYISLREAWLRNIKTPLCILSKFHCAMGYHQVYATYRVQPVHPFFVASPLDPVQSSPVVIIEGDAYCGTREEFLCKQKKAPSALHDNLTCCAFQVYQDQLAVLDVDSALLAFFTWHPSYSGLTYHNKAFGTRIEAIDSKLSDEYVRLREYGRICGSTSENMRFFLPRHMFCGSVAEAIKLMQ